MRIKGLYDLVRPSREGLKIQVYCPCISINRREFYIGGIDFDLRIGDASRNKAIKYRCFGLKILGFGFAIAKWIPWETLPKEVREKAERESSGIQ